MSGRGPNEQPNIGGTGPASTAQSLLADARNSLLPFIGGAAAAKDCASCTADSYESREVPQQATYALRGQYVPGDYWSPWVTQQSQELITGSSNQPYFRANWAEITESPVISGPQRFGYPAVSIGPYSIPTDTNSLILDAIFVGIGIAAAVGIGFAMKKSGVRLNTGLLK